MVNKPVTLGLIVGNRGFFPSHLCEDGREIILKVLEGEGINAVAISPEETPYGSVESLEEAHKLAALFKAHADEIDGVLVTLPNFGDERAIANTLRWSARFILWQNVGLQQPAPVRYQIHTHLSAHG
jgi:L-fucose isomerase-like protein